MDRRTSSIAAVLAVAGVLVAGYRWWTSPERQIRAILSDVAAAFTYDAPGGSLDTLAAVASLQAHLAPDVELQEGASTKLAGREEAITAAVRFRSATPAMRVRFFDPQITFVEEGEAAVSVTAEVRTRTGSGEDVVDVQQVNAQLERVEQRWVVTSVRSRAGAATRRSTDEAS